MAIAPVVLITLACLMGPKQANEFLEKKISEMMGGVV